MIYDELWNISKNKVEIEINILPSDIIDCVISGGDGVADHYGGRTPYIFLEKHQDRILILKMPTDFKNKVDIFQAVNCTGGYGTDILGHNILDIEECIIDALRHCPSTNDEYHSHDRKKLIDSILKLICEQTKSNINDWEITFTSTGTEAVDLAMQIVMLDGYNVLKNLNEKSEKDILIAFNGAWHGWGINPNQLIDRRQFTGGLPRLNGLQVIYIKYGDTIALESVFEKYSGRIRGVFAEGILGDGGIVIATNLWWEKLFFLSKQEDVIIVDDEIFTGFRCGDILAIPKGLSPDCITLGKGLGLGLFPLSAVLWKKEKFKLRPGIGVRTFNARPFQARIVTKAMNIIENECLFKRSREVGSLFLENLHKIKIKYPLIVKDIRGKGLLFGIELSNEFARKGHEIRNLLLENGVITEVESGVFGRHIKKEDRVNQTIRIAPPLSINEDELHFVYRQIINSFNIIMKKKQLSGVV